MKQSVIHALVRDAVKLVLVSLVTAGLVFQLGVHSINLMPALVVLALMTPMVASFAVQLYRDLNRYRDGDGGHAGA